MIIPYDKYYERIRNNRNFLATLILGIIGAGIITLFIEYLPDEIKKSIFMPISLFIIFIIVLFYASRFSQKMEKVIVRYMISIDPGSFDSFRSTTLQAIPDKADYKIELDQILQNMNKIFEIPTLCENAGFGHLQPYSQQLISLRSRIHDHLIVEMLSKIHDAVNNLNTLQTTLIDSLQKNSEIVKKNGYIVEKIQSGIVLKKVTYQIFKKEILRISFENYIDRSLLYPVHCHTEMSPFLSIKEYTLLIDEMNRLFVAISTEKTFLELGIKFNLMEDIRYKNRFEQDFYIPLLREINKSLDKISIGLPQENVE
jgi:hypothetical protein